MKINNKYSRGYSLLELLFVLAILGGVLVLDIQRKQIEFFQANARNLGVEVFRISNGVQKWISYNSGSSPSLGVKNGVDWLKSTTCGGTSDVEFLPCNFLGIDGKTTFGRLNFTTTVSSASDGVLTAVIVFDELVVKGQTDFSLSGIAAMVASGSWMVGQSDPSLFSSDADIKFCITASTMPECAGRVGRIVVVASTQSLNEKWLRVDHGNTMKNILEFDSAVTGIDPNGFSLRQIQNVARVYNEGASGFDALYLGKRGGTLPSTVSDVGVVVDANAAVLGTLEAFDDIKSTSGDISAIGVSSGSGIKGGNLIAKGVYNSAGTLVGGGNVNADGNISAGRNAIVGAYRGGRLVVMKAGSTFDITTLSPGDIRADENMLIGHDIIVENDGFIHGNLDVDSDLNVDGFADVGRDLDVRGIMYGQLLIDRNDTRFMIDPNSVSVFNQIQVDSLTALNLGGPNSGKLSLNGSEINFGSMTGSSPDIARLSGNVDVQDLRVQVESGNLVSLRDLLPNLVLKESFRIQNSGSVPMPNCSASGGQPKIYVIPQTIEIRSMVPQNDTASDYENNTGYGLWTVSASVSGSNWIVSARSLVRSTTQNIAIAQTYCAY